MVNPVSNLETGFLFLMGYSHVKIKRHKNSTDGGGFFYEFQRAGLYKVVEFSRS